VSDIAIRVENLSKLYRIGGLQPRYKTLRDTMAGLAVAPIQRLRRLGQPAPSEQTLWALKDVSFEVKHGEVLGIVGRNGSGKTTLLKVLSRITEPTEGQAEIHGRVGSLLEVGTGFHPELTGRENIYLSGAILGMKRAEIDKKFDEIVQFAEIERFLDTPAKRYSSGMYVRLAFAVAAHLEPEILLVDEVLAVGDAAFQKKCLGKMSDVAKEGRTVLFVSHNMRAVQSLCGRAFQLEAGRVLSCGDPQSVIAQYLSAMSEVTSEAIWPEETAPGNSELRLTAIRVLTEDGRMDRIYPSDKDLHVELEFTANTTNPALCVGFDLVTPEGAVVLRSYQTDLPREDWPPIGIGENCWVCTIPRGLLNEGLYYLCPRIGIHFMYWIVNMDAVLSFEMSLSHGVSPLWNALGTHRRPGIVAPILGWNAKSSGKR
jgi:lipopolysaccharide transport system ATP-binding protein